MGLTNLDFVEFLKKMVGQPYWYGTCVYNCTESLLARKAKQYPSHYGSSRMAKYNKAVENKNVCADCVGLGKGFVWTNGGEGVIEAIGTGSSFKNNYATNNCPDKSANGMFTYAKSKGKNYGTIDTIPEIPGLAVCKDGHVGYYIGNGKVVEAYGYTKGIIITDLKKRPWVNWYEFPGIEYISSTVSEPVAAPVTLRKGSKGIRVKELQTILLSLGYDLGSAGADGIFGSKTYQAVKDFQTEKGLKVDGIVGKATWKALGV